MHSYVCQQRKVLDDGRVICSKVVLGEREVTVGMCRACPARACNCQHLRFSLEKRSLRPVIVRWGNGRTEIWDDQPPVISFVRSACAVSTVPISSARDCVGCALRRPWLPRDEMQSPVPETLTALPEQVLSLVGA